MSVNKNNHGPSLSATVKPPMIGMKLEHMDMDVTRLSLQPTPHVVPVKAESNEVKEDQKGPAAPTSSFNEYARVADIHYTPANALTQGFTMVEALKTSLKSLDIGKMRQELWMKELNRLKSQGAPATMIAVCGATGAGKSSLLNAILDENIVPTSGMQACTTVVTEIMHHQKSTIDGKIHFLTEDEWRDELKVLTDDLIGGDGHVKHITDLRSAAGVAWAKIHAVYPSISQDQLAQLSIDQILTSEPTTKCIEITSLLGTTEHVSAPDSKTFAKALNKYIDAKGQTQHATKKPTKDKNKMGEAGDNPSAYWPLIRQVCIWCNSQALSTGAILVDLPGVADANAARNAIAENYMGKCDRVWVVAPITRAVDDKTARDLMGDAFRMQLMMETITFIATKCDDVSCSEVIRSLSLDDEPELENMEAEIARLKTETKDWKKRKSEAEDARRDVKARLKQSRATLREYRDHMKALKNGESVRITLTQPSLVQCSSGSDSCSDLDSNSNLEESDSSDEQEETHTSAAAQKRKHGTDRSQNGPAAKRHRSSKPIGADSGPSMDINDDLMAVDVHDLSQCEKVDLELSTEPNVYSENNVPDEDVADEELEEVTVDILKAKKVELAQAIKDDRTCLSDLSRQCKQASAELAALKKHQSEAQKKMNAFCSLKRSEFSKSILKDDFRNGLIDLENVQQERENPDTFDPADNIRDYSTVDLPVFTVSARDYVRLTGQVKRDGDATCFSNLEDTGVPELQKWCHELTVAPRAKAARELLNQLTTFCRNTIGYLKGVNEIRNLFCATEPSLVGTAAGSDGTLQLPKQISLPQTVSLRKATAADSLGNGAAAAETALVKPEIFHQLSKDCVADLKECFRAALEAKCKAGVARASAAAVETADSSAAGMRWNTYRAMLVRHGSYRNCDLNEELTTPFMRQISRSWAKVFASDLFASFEQATIKVVNELTEEAANFAVPQLKERARRQCELTVEVAKAALDAMLDVAREKIDDDQKRISRRLKPFIGDQLVEGYERALEEWGPGSFARQKAVLHDYISDVKSDVFTEAANMLLEGLSDAAEAVGEILKASVLELAQKIEVNMAILWEMRMGNDPQQEKARAEAMKMVKTVLRQVKLWNAAEELARQEPEDLFVEFLTDPESDSYLSSPSP
ncbi:hypothetical protein BN946_scf184791.g14 [Trametes cinnabarina]|uniref:G domain-containing protein n=1 Tax=Pycnoporus cinnabarinus TaxID=5643 RepID=A0A060SAW2_PYCCI|nr:hypothetical protein BN946_scf184791.g14 [Trametes cinnabarina]